MDDKKPHTPEPWYTLSGGIISNAVGPHWAATEHFVASSHDAAKPESVVYANQQRIVACVNALAGVADPVLLVAEARKLALFNTGQEDTDDLLRMINNLRRVLGYASAKRGIDWPEDTRPCVTCGHEESQHFDVFVNNCAEANGDSAPNCQMCRGTCPGEHLYVPAVAREGAKP